MLMLVGWSGPEKDAVKSCAQELLPKEAGNKRARVADIRMRKGVWKRYGMSTYPELAKVALRLMSVHPTSCAAECNWSCWGRLYTTARDALGLERAKKMIAFSFNSRAQKASMTDLALDLAVVEGETEHEQDHQDSGDC